MKHFMIRYIIIPLIYIAACYAAVSAQITKNYVLEIGDFSEITVAHGVNVEYFSRSDSAGFAKFDSAPEYASVISFDNRKGTLKIEIVADAPLEGQLPTLKIYSSTLAKATNLADSTLTLCTTAPVESLSLKVIGNGSIVAPAVHATKVSAAVVAGSGRIFLAGRAGEGKYTLASSGTIEARGLQAEKVKCSMFGTGSIDCYPLEQLTVIGATSGTVYYAGSPEIKNRSIGAKLVKMDE